MTDEMHQRHDLDLIAALAEGRLDDPSPAEEQVATCAACADVYRAHRVVLAAIAADPVPRLDDLERRRLRQGVWAGLGVADDAPVRSTPWWYRVAPVAAALVVVVGIVAILTGGQGDSGVDLTQARETFSADTTAGDMETMSESTEAAGTDAPGGAGESGTTAAADTTAPADTVVTNDVAMSEDGYARVASEFADRVAAGETDVDEAFDCVYTDASGEPEDVEAAEGAFAAGTLLWVAANEEEPEIEVRIYRSSDCVEVYRHE